MTLDQLLEGSAQLRKIAARKIPTSAKVVGKVLKTVVKHPLATLGTAALIPGAYRKWKTTVQQASPFNPRNVSGTSFWRRPQ